MDLVEETAAVRPEGPMDRARRPAGIGAVREILATPALGIVAHRQVTLDQINLFPILMDERFRREYAGRKAQEAGAASASPLLVERAGQNLLLDAGRIAGRRRPPGAHVDAVEFEMGLVDGHGLLLATSLDQTLRAIGPARIDRWRWRRRRCRHGLHWPAA